MAALKVRSVFRSIEQAHTQEKLLEALQSKEAQDAAVEIIASENHIPKFLAVKVYRLLVERFHTVKGSPSTNEPS